MFTVPTSTASQVLASVSSIFADPGLISVVVLAAGIPLAFYVIKALIGLFPKGRSRTH